MSNVLEIEAYGKVIGKPSEVFSYTDGSKKQYATVEVLECESHPGFIGFKLKGIRVISNKDGSIIKEPINTNEGVCLKIKATPGEEPVVFLNSKSYFPIDNHLINGLLFG